MKLLIVEDDQALAEITADLLKACDWRPAELESFTLVADLETAMHCLQQHDAVLCDGRFPLAPHSPFIVDDWDVIRQEAMRWDIHFVLYSGSVVALESARAIDIPTVTKPASIEEIYAALTRRQLPCSAYSRPEALANMIDFTPPQSPGAGKLDAYCKELEGRAEALAQQVESDVRSNHLHAFNFGRTLARIEYSREKVLLRVRWLLFGAAAGVMLTAALLMRF